MADFKISWLKTSTNEGGYVNNSKDPGKETYRGISIRFWPKWEGWPTVHAVIGFANTLDAGNVVWKAITSELANNIELDKMVQAFYKLHFWDPLDLSSEPDQSIADSAFDAAVNKGVGKEKKSLEQSRNEADEIV